MKTKTYDSFWNPWTQRLAAGFVAGIFVIGGLAFAFTKVAGEERKAEVGPGTGAAAPSGAPSPVAPTRLERFAAVQNATVNMLAATIARDSIGLRLIQERVEAETGCVPVKGGIGIAGTRAEAQRELQARRDVFASWPEEGLIPTHAKQKVPEPKSVVHLVLGWACP